MNLSHRCMCTGLVVAAVVGTRAARASGVPEAGSTTIALAAGVAHANVEGTGSTLKLSNVIAAPTFDAVVAGGLTLGVGIPFSWSRVVVEGAPSQSSYTIRPTLRVGYLVPLGERAAFWPVATLARGSAHAASGRAEWDTKSWEAGLSLQVLIPLDERFYVRVSPLEARWSDQRVATPSGGFGVAGASLGSAFAVGAWL